MLMDNTTRTMPQTDIAMPEPSVPVDVAQSEAASLDAAADVSSRPAPVALYRAKRGAGWRSVLAAGGALGMGWIASNPMLFNPFQQLVAGLFGLVGLLFLVASLLPIFDRQAKIIIDDQGIFDARVKFGVRWADLRRAWLIEAPGGAVLALEPASDAATPRKTLWQQLRQQDASLGFPPVTMPMSGLAYMSENVLAAISAHKPEAVLS